MIRYATGERTSHYDQVRTLNLRVRDRWARSSRGSPGSRPSTAAARPSAARRSRPIRSWPRSTAAPRWALRRRRGHALPVRRQSRLVGRAHGRARASGRAARRALHRRRRLGALAQRGHRRGRRVELPLAAGDFALLRSPAAARAHRGRAATRRSMRRPTRGAASVALRGHARAGASTLTLLDLNGRRIWARAARRRGAGRVWDGRDDDGTRVRPGLLLGAPDRRRTARSCGAWRGWAEVSGGPQGTRRASLELRRVAA
jgi:hypothetical protein